MGDFYLRDWLLAIGTGLAVIVLVPLGFFVYHLWIQYLFGKETADIVTFITALGSIILVVIGCIIYLTERTGG